MLRTAVIGAGPAGMLFTLIGKIMLGDAWSVQLYDKRESYARTHRLRMAPEPYRAIQRELSDPRFDALLAFLEEQHFAPEVNRLEAKLSTLLAELGVHKIVRDVTTLEALAVDTIVGADSVHSTVRALVSGAVTPRGMTHQRVARLRVTGSDLPAQLNVIDRFRLSKVLGSVVDYRLNRNGFAEVDLFLSPAEHALLHGLGASPKAPLPIRAAQLDPIRAPLLHAIVAHLERSGRSIVLQSTFELAHSVMPRVAFQAESARVFLVGDAAVSLPFFRGMACLASSCHALARAHAAGRFDDYERDVAAVVERELAIVRSRAQLIRGVRELIRVSALLPFPIQSWWLSAARDPAPDRISAGTWFNLALALTATLPLWLAWRWPALALLSLPLQLAGGMAYRWTLQLEPGPHRYLRRVWELQVAMIALAGLTLSLTQQSRWLAAGWWWLSGLAFAAGIYAFERVVRRPLDSAQLDTE